MVPFNAHSTDARVGCMCGFRDHGIQHQIVVTIIKSRKGDVMLPCDRWGMDVPYGPSLGSQSIVQHAPIGRIADPAAWHVNASSTGGPPATSMQSHHVSFVELRNGSFAAIGRHHDINGTMPYALSTDGGYRWTAKQSSFTGIHGGQREVMIRLGSIDQPLMHCTFANSLQSYEGSSVYKTTWIPDSAGGEFSMRGVYCAVSFDDGASWETRRPITADLSVEGRNETGSDGAPFRMSFNSSEPAGYMAAAVSDDGIITLITSRNSYSFNLAWLKLKAPPPQSVAVATPASPATASLGQVVDYHCSDKLGCELLGECVSGTCQCRPGFTGPSCGEVDLAPADATTSGVVWPQAPSLHANQSFSWGFTVVKDEATSLYHAAVNVGRYKLE